MRLAKGAAVLALILLISVSAGMLHYAYRTGNVAPIKDAARVLSQDKGLHPLVSSLLDGKALAKDLAQSVKATLKPSGAATSHETPPEDAGDIRVYFAPCQKINPFGIEHAFLGFLERARKSIYGAFYELQLMDAAEVLIAKHQAGVDVRLVSDSDYREREAVQTCIQAGIPVVFDERGPFMHDKFCVVDGVFVWTGSTNITENCMYRNNNNSLLITSDKLAADYTSEFGEMFDQHLFGKKSPSNTPYPEVVVGDTRIECYFAPEDHVQQHIVREIKEAGTSIDVMAFSFTADKIAKAMVERLKQGVRVRALFDTRQAHSEHAEDNYLADQGAQVYLDDNKYAMHDKVIVIDVNTVITGSYNFTNAAETKNDENVLIVHSPAIAGKYESEFESLLAHQAHLEASAGK